MKKIMYLTLVLGLLTAFGVNGVGAYDIPDTTLGQEWLDGGVWGGWVDVIGSVNTYDVFGANVSGNTFSIFTNWNPTKDSGSIITADLFIDKDCNGSFDYAIVLDANQSDFKQVYLATNITTSFDVFGGGVLIYGGKYDMAVPKTPPVLASGNPVTTVDVNWTYGAGNLNNQVDIDLTNLGLTGAWCFFWGPTTCANDPFAGQVPLPPSVLLLGSSLVGLGFLRWRSSRPKN